MENLMNEMNNFDLDGDIIPVPFVNEAKGIQGFTRALSRGFEISNLDDMATLYNTVYR